MSSMISSIHYFTEIFYTQLLLVLIYFIFLRETLCVVIIYKYAYLFLPHINVSIQWVWLPPGWMRCAIRRLRFGSGESNRAGLMNHHLWHICLKYYSQLHHTTVCSLGLCIWIHTSFRIKFESNLHLTLNVIVINQDMMCVCSSSVLLWSYEVNK